jgi:hypothetical protein
MRRSTILTLDHAESMVFFGRDALGRVRIYTWFCAFRVHISTCLAVSNRSSDLTLASMLALI